MKNLMIIFTLSLLWSLSSAQNAAMFYGASVFNATSNNFFIQTRGALDGALENMQDVMYRSALHTWTAKEIRVIVNLTDESRPTSAPTFNEERQILVQQVIGRFNLVVDFEADYGIAGIFATKRSHAQISYLTTGASVELKFNVTGDHVERVTIPLTYHGHIMQDETPETREWTSKFAQAQFKSAVQAAMEKTVLEIARLSFGYSRIVPPVPSLFRILNKNLSLSVSTLPPRVVNGGLAIPTNITTGLLVNMSSASFPIFNPKNGDYQAFYSKGVLKTVIFEAVRLGVFNFIIKGGANDELGLEFTGAEFAKIFINHTNASKIDELKYHCSIAPEEGLEVRIDNNIKAVIIEVVYLVKALDAKTNEVIAQFKVGTLFILHPKHNSELNFSVKRVEMNYIGYEPIDRDNGRNFLKKIFQKISNNLQDKIVAGDNRDIPADARTVIVDGFVLYYAKNAHF